MVINDDIFADWYCDVYDNLDEFVGKKCKHEYNGYMVQLLTDVTITEGEAPDVEYIYYKNYW